MRRQRQCPAEPPGYRGAWQCQLLLGHEGLHKASVSEQSTDHFSWGYNAIGAFEAHTLPGTVMFRSARMARAVKIARAAGEWTALVLAAFFLWWAASLTTAAVFFALELLLSVRRPHFAHLGRFTVGVRPASSAGPMVVLGVLWAEYKAGPNARNIGFEFVFGGTVVGAFVRVLHRTAVEPDGKEAGR
ncbi:hypothetical protein ACFWCA_19280 [Streptomyces phaeochromogenes]|uniref:hypothetical protein n=1 Tax=Streptomyces phaeochromogenes TaxID=1923 RepID=UPI0036BC3140